MSAGIDRRALLSGAFEAVAPAGSSDDSPPEIPAEIQARAAAFRAERDARPSGAGPGSVVHWLHAQPAPLSAEAGRIRPPGAVAEADFLARCSRCGDCALVCPHEIIRVAARGPDAGTPVLSPSEAPCRMCEDLPCVYTCPTGALSPDAPSRVATASVNPLSCLNALGGFCSVCVERCPTPGAMRLDGRAVVVDAAACTGCGQCAWVCPAPGGAIALRPATGRPAAPVGAP